MLQKGGYGYIPLPSCSEKIRLTYGNGIDMFLISPLPGGIRLAIRMVGMQTDKYASRRTFKRLVERAAVGPACTDPAGHITVSALGIHFRERIAHGTGRISYGNGQGVAHFVFVIRALRDLAVRYYRHSYSHDRPPLSLI